MFVTGIVTFNNEADDFNVLIPSHTHWIRKTIFIINIMQDYDNSWS